MAAYYYNQDFMDQFIGNGMSVSKVFDKLHLNTSVISGTDKIHDSIYTILSTKIGERFMLPEFGSKLHLVLFEPNNYIFKDLVQFYVKDALSKWEKRIEVMDVKVVTEVEGNIVPIEITYQITNSNIIDTYVYPFNITREGNPSIYRQGDIHPDTY